jgi:hypothetical protein
MSTLTEIEAAAAGLSASEKSRLLLFLAAQPRAEGAPAPEPRRFTKEQMDPWIREDEADTEHFQQAS